MIKRSFLFFSLLLISGLVFAQSIPVTFQWDASATIGTTDNPIKYRMCSSSIAPASWPTGGFPTDRVVRDAGTALEFPVNIVVGTFYFFATAYNYGMTVDGVIDTTKLQESGPSNVLKIVVTAPPGNPSKVRIKSVTQVQGTTSGQTMKVGK